MSEHWCLKASREALPEPGCCSVAKQRESQGPNNAETNYKLKSAGFFPKFGKGFDVQALDRGKVQVNYTSTLPHLLHSLWFPEGPTIS